MKNIRDREILVSEGSQELQQFQRLTSDLLRSGRIDGFLGLDPESQYRLILNHGSQTSLIFFIFEFFTISKIVIFQGSIKPNCGLLYCTFLYRDNC